MLQIRRRDLLAGLAATIGLPRVARAAEPLRSLLDRAAVEKEPARAAALLRAADGGSLSAADRRILRMVVRGLDRDAALRRFGFAEGPYRVTQRHGAWLDLAGGRSDAAARLDAETERLRGDAAAGIVPPGFVLDAVIAAQRALFARTADPALRRQTEALEALRARAGEGAGVWRLPRGSAYYAARLSAATGSDLTPAALDARVAAATHALLARADRLLSQLGLREGGVGARLRQLKGRSDYLFANDEAGRARAVAGMNAALHRLRPHLATWFDPPLGLGATVKLMREADIAAGKRGYREPPTATNPGAYYPDLGNVAERPASTLTTVAYHETIPGHLLQLAHQSRAAPHPLQVKYAPGYSEGWAIYAESLADGLGLLSPVEQLGFLQSTLFRLARVTADIGLHVHRWDRARAIAYLRETVGFELFFPFDVEVDRYAVEPAGFAGDAAVALALIERGTAARRRGPAAGRAFHAAALDVGPLSIEALPS